MNYIIFDAHYLLHRILHTESYQKLTTSDGRFSGGLYGLLKILGNVLKQFTPQRCVFAWDGGHSERRKELYPEHKSGRAISEGEGVCEELK